MIAGAMVLAGVAPASAATDVSTPVVVSSYAPVTTADVTNGPAQLTVKIRITDETAVRDDFLLRIYSLDSGQSIGFSYKALESGTLQNGVWKGITTLPQGSAGGQWMIQAFYLGDTVNNRTNGFIDVRAITVTNNAVADVSTPEVVSSYMPVTTLDVTNGPAQLMVKIRITDETAVRDDFLLRVYSEESGQSIGFSYKALESGTLQNGVWKAITTLPQGAAGGKWMIHAFYLGDTMNNRTNGFIDVKAFSVISGSTTDVSIPQVVSSYAPVSTLDVTNAPAQLTVKIRITDETAVRDDFLLRIYSEESGQSIGFSYKALESGTLQNGVWKGIVTLPQGSAAGRWMVHAFNLGDYMNNRSNGFIDVRAITVISGSP